MRKRCLAFAGLASVALIASARAAPVTQDDFLVATTGNLVALCGAAETDPLYTAARNFCHGFGIGTYRALAIQEAASRAKRKMFCMPPNEPTRDQAMAAFVQWASARPSTLASAPTDGIAEFLISHYPCR
ncbi:MAG TPA: Rap1a/Tai family immunity protein [Acetobacteraceae bacterium]|nr:Rap1a/Tai family immunity protein [Acetobacteraceae bacterium]